MGKAIYNWEQIKKEYFTSPILEASTYMQQRYGRDVAGGGNISKNIVGWTEDKKAWIKEQEKKSLEAYEEERLKKEKEIVKIAVNGEQQAIQIAYALLTSKIEIDSESGAVKNVKHGAKDLKTLVEIFRLAQGKPMAISKNDNVNVNKTVDDLIKELQEQNANEVDPDW